MFAKMILDNAGSEVKKDNVIEDGAFRCSYGELPGVFAALDDFFNDAKIPAHQCLIFRCGNSLPEAVLLLWLLSRKRDALLLPRVLKGREKMEDANLPEFCKYKIAVDLSAPDLDIAAPAGYTRVGINASFNENGKTDISPGTGHLFLRTSGSTAEPKLVMHTHDKLYGNIMQAARRLELKHDDRIIIPVPVYHMYGLGAGFLPGAAVGASIRLLANTNVIRYMEEEKRFQPNVSFMTPALIEMLLHIRKSVYEYRLVVSAGDRIRGAVFEEFENKFGKLVNLYGSTELGVIATNRLNDPLAKRAGGVVKPLPCVKIRLEHTGRDDGDGDNTADEMAGILCNHEFGLAAYLDRKGRKITGQDISWFSTNDLGRQLDGDTFKVMGRTGNSMNRSGILVSFAEVESIMEQGCGDVRHAVVIGRDEKQFRGKKMVAYCQLNPGSSADGKAIRSACFDIMQRYMVPDEVIVMDELPRLPNGKFDRKGLAALV